VLWGITLPNVYELAPDPQIDNSYKPAASAAVSRKFFQGSELGGTFTKVEKRRNIRAVTFEMIISIEEHWLESA
jgi:hypothetical protein